MCESCVCERVVRVRESCVCDKEREVCVCERERELCVRERVVCERVVCV